MSSAGFTLIELLVVVAIIGLLASIVGLSLTTMQSRARDTRRMEDVRSLQKGLALYMVSNGTYPDSSSATTTLTGTDDVSQALIADEAFSAMPQDPQYPTYSYTYSTNVAGNTYLISFCLETDSIEHFVQGCGNTVRP